MSNVIDQKVVEMKFNNKNFESNVQTSLSTLDKLKRGLNLSGAAKGLEDVGSAAKGIDFSGIGSAVESVSSKFSALGVMGVTALVNITNSAVNAGKRIVSALTIDPVKTGLQEYETQINAIQTILANTAHNGTTLDQVNDALDELNKYADLTIYNFTEMTKNIGTFTAAGLDLDTSVKGIQGIANLAAVSGSTSAQASTAMYQLSQAMAAGTVTLQDWNSVVNASMGGKVFQDAIIQTAKDLGMESEAVRDAVAAYEGGANFRSILNAKDNGQWLSSDILVAALSKFTKTGAVEYLSDLYDVSASSIEELQKLGDTTGYNTDEFDKMVSALSNGDEAMAKNIKDVLSMANTATAAATEVKTLSQLWDTLKETAQSGWTQTWELIVGDFEEAKKLLSGVYNTLSPILEASAAARNELLQGWKDAGGRDDLIQSFRNVYEAIKSIINPIKEAFREIFPPTTAAQLASFTEGLKNITAKLTLSETASENLKRTFKGLFAVLDIVKQGFTVAFAAIKPWLSGLDNLGGGILSVTAKIGDWLVSLRDGTKKLDAFAVATNSFAAKNKFVSTIKSIVEWCKELGSVLNTKFVAPGLENLQTLLERIKERMSDLSGTADKVKTVVSNAFKSIGDAISNAFSKIDFLDILGSLFNGLIAFGGAVVKAFSGLAKGLSGLFGKADFNSFFDVINSIIAGGVGVGIIKFLKGAKDAMDGVGDTLGGIKGIIDSATEIFDSFRGCLEAYQTKLKAETLKTIAIAIAILVASLLVVSLIDSEKLSKAVGAITMLFGGLVGSMAALDKMTTGVKGASKLVGVMVGMSISVLILAGALKKISDINAADLTKSLIGIAGLAGVLIATVKILGKDGGTAMKGATQMVIFAAAIKILASVCADMAALSWEEMAKGLIGVGVLMAEISLFLNNTKFQSKSMSTAIGLIGLAAAIKILASACKTFAAMSWEEIGKGLAAIGGLLAELALFTNLTGNAKHVISTGIALVTIAASMKIFASAMKDFGNMSWESIAKGLIAMSGALAEVTIAVNLMPKNLFGTGVGLVVVASALLILAQSLSSMGNMSWESIAKGLVALGGSMLILALGLNAMNGTLAGSAALLIASVAILALVPAITTLGSMSWESIAKGLIVLAGAFGIMGVAGAVLTPLVPTILALARAFALIGVAVLAIGAGLLAAGSGLSALSLGLTAFGASLSASATAIVAALTIIIIGIVSLIPAIVVAIWNGIAALAAAIAAGAPAIFEALKVLTLGAIDMLVTCIPPMVDGILKIIFEVLDALVTYIPPIVDALLKLIIGIIDALADNLPGLIESVVNLVMQFFAGVVEALKGIDVGVLLEGIAGIGLMAGIMAALAAVAGLVPGAMIGVLGIGAVIAELALVLAAIGALAQIPGLDWLIGEGGDFLQLIGNAIGKFVGGIVGGVAEGFTSSLPKIGSDLSEFMTNVSPFVEGAKNINSAVMDGVKTLAEVILILTAANILDGLASWFTGESSLTHFGEQLPALGTSLNQFVTNLGEFSDDQIKTVTCAANAIKELAIAADAIPNEGGWIAKLVGDNSIATFGDKLPGLATNLKTFVTNLGTFDSAQISTVTCAANAIKAMAEAADAIPNEGGWVAKIVGDNSIATFGDNLPGLAKNLKEFVGALGVFSDGQINTVASAGEALKSLALAADAIPNDGGWVAAIVGENSLVEFGDKLPGLGTNLRDFALNLGTFGDDQIKTITCAANALRSMAEIADDIPNEGGWLAAIVGDNSIATFGANIPPLGTYLHEFISNLGTFGNAQIATTSSAVKAITAFATLADSDLKGAKKNLEGFGEKIVGLSDDITSFVSGMPSSGDITSAIGNVNKLLKLLKDIAKADASAISKFTKDLGGIGKDGVKAFVEAFTNSSAKSDVKKSAIELINQVIKGAESKINNLKKSFTKIVTAAKDAIRDTYDDFYSAGSYLVDGFAAGISENDYKATAKATSMAKKALNAAKVALGEHSPSKEFYKVGDYAGQGFVNALFDYGDKSYAASSDMALSARKGLIDSVSKIKDVIDSDIDSQPVVRPVLDLSNVESGARAIGTLFNTKTAMGVVANVESISSMMNRNTRYGKNSEVVSAIDKLRKDLGENVGNTYNIDGVTYDDGSNVSNAVRELVRAARVERRK